MATSVTSDLDRYYQDVAKASGKWDAELARAHKETAERGAEWARFEAAGSGGKWGRQRAVAIDSIKPKSSAKAAQIAVYSSGRAPFALAAYWGAKRHAGWYGAAKYRQSAGKQFAPWVGSDWAVAVAGEGPYAINDALAKHLKDIDEFFLSSVDRATSNVYPDK